MGTQNKTQQEGEDLSLLARLVRIDNQVNYLVDQSHRMDANLSIIWGTTPKAEQKANDKPDNTVLGRLEFIIEKLGSVNNRFEGMNGALEYHLLEK